MLVETLKEEIKPKLNISKLKNSKTFPLYNLGRKINTKRLHNIMCMGNPIKLDLKEYM